MTKQILNESGISLVEVMVAIAVLAVGILGAMAVLFTCDKEMENNHRMSLAIFAAEEKLNEVTMGIDWEKNMPTSITSLNNRYFKVDGLPFYRLATEPEEAQPGRVEIDEVTDPRVFQVRIIVEWTVVGATERRAKYELCTTLAKAL